MARKLEESDTSKFILTCVGAVSSTKKKNSPESTDYG